MSTKYVSGRVKELKIGVSNYSESKESLSVIGIVSATKFYGDGSNLTGAQIPGVDPSGSSTFNNLNVTGVSTFAGNINANGNIVGDSATNISGINEITAAGNINANGNIVGDNSTNISGIASVTAATFYGNGSGLTNVQIPGIAPAETSTFNNLEVTGVSTFQGNLDIESSVLITGITTISGLVDINDGGQANTFKVEDLTNGRVVYAGAGGELQDSANLTFDGTTLTSTFAGNGAALTNLSIPGIAPAETSTFNNLEVTGVSTFAGNINANGNIVGDNVTNISGIASISATTFHGDGSNLTGIDATSLKDSGNTIRVQATTSGAVVTGVLTATSFSGTVPSSSLSGQLPALDGSNLTALNATNLGSGIVPDDRFPATLPAISGANLTNLPTGINTDGTSDFTTLNVSTLLDVDGHTELDDLNVTGVSTFSGLIDGNAGANITGDLVANSAKISDLTNGRVVYAGASGELQDSSNLTFNGTTLNGTFSGDGTALSVTIPGISTTLTSEFTNLNLSGIITAAGAVFDTARVTDLTNNRVVIVGSNGELEDTTKLTFDGSTLAIVGDATFTGNVSVAGTLTSEDKTNIDSVGLITARTGVRVDSGGIVVSSGVVTFTDAIDSNGGANISGGLGLVASSAKVSDLTSGRVVVVGTSGELQDASTFTFSGGTVTAGAFAGDGSALTGITAAGTGAIGGITVKDEGVTVGTAGSVSSFDFRGSYITAIATAGAAGVATVTVSETPTFSTVAVTNNITANGNIVGDNSTNITGIAGVVASSLTGTLQTASQTNVTSLGTLSAVTVSGNITANGNIVGDNSTNITGIAGVTASGTVQAGDFNSTSDIRLKDNIQVIEDPLAKLVQIEGVSFNWKENNKPALGVIADQVQEILPELVTDGDPKTVNYNGLIGLLIEAVKEQQIQIDELKSKLP